MSYVDPYASSAAEMITEMIQYVEDGVKIKAFEADALYAGIILIRMDLIISQVREHLRQQHFLEDRC